MGMANDSVKKGKRGTSAAKPRVTARRNSVADGMVKKGGTGGGSGGTK